MGKQRPNPHLAKLHRSYTVDEIARLFSVHRNTVRAWIKRGLPTVDDKRPLLVLGRHLGEFLQARREVNRRTTGPGFIYCLRCREPRQPAGGVVRYELLSPSLGNLVGRCCACDAGLYRRVAAAKLGVVLGDLRVRPPLDWEHIGDSTQPSLNSAFNNQGPTHANASP